MGQVQPGRTESSFSSSKNTQLVLLGARKVPPQAVSYSSELIAQLTRSIGRDASWQERLQTFTPNGRGDVALHLAIFVEPYLGYVLDGRKTVESRFSAVRCAPWGEVHRGDVILLKRSGGPIVAISTAADVWSYHLDPVTWIHVREEFARALCAEDPSFWTERARAEFATLIRLERVQRVPPMDVPKRDRRGWVVLVPRRREDEAILAGG
jgi:hypothetical protein